MALRLIVGPARSGKLGLVVQEFLAAAGRGHDPVLVVPNEPERVVLERELTSLLDVERFDPPAAFRERALLKRGIADGELPTGLNLDATLDALIGPIVYRALPGAKVSRPFVDALVDRVLEC